METTSTVNIISGKIIVKETGVPVPDLLVVLYDLDSSSSFNTAINATLPPNSYEFGDRLGSVLTGPDGTWSLSYTDTAFGPDDPSEKRPDLFLMVMAPEDSDSTNAPVVLHSSKVLRVNSGRSEAYIIRLAQQPLLDAHLIRTADQADTEKVESTVDKFRREKISRHTLKQEMKGVIADAEDLEAPYSAPRKSALKSMLFPDTSNLGNLYVVNESDDVKTIQHEAFEQGKSDINTMIGLSAIQELDPAPTTQEKLDYLDVGRGIKMHFFLTDVEKAELEEFKVEIDANTYYYKLPESKVAAIMAKREAGDGISTILFSQNPLSRYCLEKTSQQKCAEYHLELTDNEPAPGPDPENPPLVFTDVTNADIPKYLNKILNGGIPGPNGAATPLRPTAASVQNNVNAFALQKGPADTTAFYDFHTLQIAFDHVWQQLLDQTLVNLAEQIHVEQENSGAKGWMDTLQTNQLTMRGPSDVQAAIQQALSNTRSEEVPSDLAAAFDISYLEYMSLSIKHRKKLDDLADHINEHERRLAAGNGSAIAIAEATTRISLLRDQGERIIDHARTNKLLSTNAMLKELQERLHSKYAFTVFAADKDHQSINFGLINTYRQEWEPVSYQAGRLVRTMPLSPKEERKYAMKVTRNLKSSKKEALKNNSSINQERNSTSRAEAEIMSKVMDKSHFDAGASFDGWGFHAEANFGKDSEKESSQSKKDFRESVLKATQEYKEERSVEIDTEDTYSSEHSETGTIVNPNDELSVTYLFYELQRRYRVSEKLHRIAPVVMVAQPVPAPHQITEGWVVAHDWILNRVLLDDSFRPTVQMIGTKSVGDDYAIRELRKNLRQQRALVNSLQIEQSKLNRNADNKYNGLTRLISERIEEEHRDRFEHWWNDEDSDPQRALAKERAASDQHKHAVEQAQQMAVSLQQETMALRQLTTEYNTAMRDHLDKITQVRRLLTHIRENILYYMQAI